VFEAGGHSAVNRVQMFHQENFEKRTQDLAPAFQDAAQLYCVRVSAWLLGQCVFSEASAPVPLPPHRVHNLDTPEDWQEAEFFFNSLNLMPTEK